MKRAQKIIKRSPNPKLIEESFEFAKEAYKDKNRLSGENYIEHALRVADFLDKMGLDANTIAFAILHDTIDDIPQAAKEKQLNEVEKKFGREISLLLKKISDLGRIRYSLYVNIKENKTPSREKIENLRRMFFAIAGDIRVILVELVSRIDGLNFLNHLPADKQKLYSLETLKIFVPIANRLGLSKIRRELEDKSFSYLFPEKFSWIKSNIKEEYEEREKHLRYFVPKLKKILKKERVKTFDINYRSKSYWSTYLKLIRHDMDFDKIHDLIALRIIVSNTEECYRVLGIIHKHFKPISEEINDYIAKPKKNGYRSLHTTIFCEPEKISEIQIRTQDMHDEAEYGICAHWSYKEGVDISSDEEKLDWSKRMPEFVQKFKIDFFEKQIFALTPKGDIIVLKKGSTPVDFAYAIHSEIGNHIESAKIAGKIIPLSHQIENGDVIEILTNKKKIPSQDWLKFVKTGLAQSHIKKAISKNGSLFNFPIPGFIKQKFIEISQKAEKQKKEKEQLKKHIDQIYLGGQKGMLVNIAKCCNPKPGDKVHAYLTKHRSAVLHKNSCQNFRKLAEKYPEKIINASWQ